MRTSVHRLIYKRSRDRAHENRGQVIRLVGLVALIATACQAPAATLATPPPSTPTPIIHGTLPISTAAPASAFDRQFIDMLVPHHEAAIEMVRIAQARGQRAELKAVAEEIERVQAQEMEDMLAWREAWFGSRTTPAMNEVPVLLEPGAPVASGAVLTSNFTVDVESLRTAPEPFEATFIDTFLKHQQRAVEAAELAIRRARQQEILDLSGSMLAEHQRWRRQLSDLR
jgi:uncharacterized protein (DUF305 family)